MIKPKENIRVLLVDDSELVRAMIRDILESEPDISVVAEAGNGKEAIEKIARFKPDIVTMDIEMPVMGGLEAIELIISENPLPILVVTALTGVRTAFAAVSKGALDVIEKPDISPENVRSLIKKIRLLSKVDVATHLLAMNRPAAAPVAHVTSLRKKPSLGGVVAIASSTGGPHCIHNILSHLPANFPVPIIITQHIAEGFTQGMVDWLNTATPLKVNVAASGVVIEAGNVYVNPAENTMRITEQGMIHLGAFEANDVYHPSCNTMLSSVASVFRERAIGLIMSGMGNDGVAGMQAIKSAGGTTLAQDAGSSVVYGMNRLAVEGGHILKVIPLSMIPAELIRRTGVK
ncbi:MAG: chemotaxis-specific protein-glutamate methyltransferase CheB [Desulfuromonadaceae bacterium]|nr:chemotaxis-specific protein-glutamate methyltransferase CheB [Desulfuromonadaceae bacterium]MDD2854611.1 chemotaxis-specific protein-glutamate methyltransferase CheB [Desulfuromonadaceae bacterium]